ncbi:MAG: magnesium transporter MgtE N-terminal domain-containing protein [Acetobacteraceae bacterium]
MTFASFRVLPATIMVTTALLGLKTFELVRAATPAAAIGAVPAAQAQAPEQASGAAGTQTSEAMPGAPAVPGSRPAPGAPAVPGSPALPSATANAPAGPPVSSSEKALLQDLRQRRLGLDKREESIAARESVLAAAEHKLDQRVAELQALQQHLEALNAARKQRDDASWQGLVKMYADMKPRDAAKIFDDLDMSVLLEVVDRMNERKAAAIFAAMQPDRARDVTARLAAMRLKQNSGS